jgi:protein gp37
MSDKSKIEWTEATWNPVTGCTKVSQGCKHCYAEREWQRLTKLVPAYAGRKFSDVRCHPERLEQPLHWKKPRRIFVNSMSDLFHEDVPVDFIEQVFDVMRRCPQHTFQILTKRAGRMQFILWSELDWEPLPNVWLGVSVEDQATAFERLPLLRATPAAVRWLSIEPCLGPIHLGAIPRGGAGKEGNIHWVVVGGESGPNARPMHPAWVMSLRNQCERSELPFFFKQWGEWAPVSNLPEDTRLDFAHWAWVNSAGGDHIPAFVQFKKKPANHELMGRVGKKLAGRLLDGVLHDEYPEVAR